MKLSPAQLEIALFVVAVLVTIQLVKGLVLNTTWAGQYF